MEVALLDVLAVVGFAGNQAEEAFLEDRVMLVPDGQRPAEYLVAVAEAGDAVFAPPERFGPRQIVRKVRPGIAVFTVILAHRSPCAVGEIGSPLAPAGDLVRFAGEAISFGVHGFWKMSVDRRV